MVHLHRDDTATDSPEKSQKARQRFLLSEGFNFTYTGRVRRTPSDFLQNKTISGKTSKQAHRRGAVQKTARRKIVQTGSIPVVTSRGSILLYARTRDLRFCRSIKSQHMQGPSHPATQLPNHPTTHPTLSQLPKQTQREGRGDVGHHE